MVDDGARQRRYVVCFNPVEAERQRQHRQVVLDELAAEIKTLRKPGRGEGHSKRTCELLSTPRFARYLRQAPWGGLKIDLSAVRREKKLDGKWVITSNDDTLSAEDLALGFLPDCESEQDMAFLLGLGESQRVAHDRTMDTTRILSDDISSR